LAAVVEMRSKCEINILR